MRLRKFFPAGKIKLCCTVFAILGLLTGEMSCQKSDITIKATSPAKNLTDLQDLFKGEVITGPLSVLQEPEGLIFFYKGEEQIIFLERVPSIPIISTGNIQHAELMYSTFGVIIRDTDRNKTWVYVQNDPESRKQFDRVRSFLEKNFLRSDIAGTTRINLQKS